MKQIYQNEVDKYNYLYGETEYNIEDLNNPRFIHAKRFIHSIKNVKKVLDAGTGRGTYYRYLKSNFDTYGLEASNTAVERYYQGDTKIKNILISDIPNNYSKEEFDVVICLEVMEHLPPDTTFENIAALHYATKKYAIISVANFEDIIDGRNVHINLREYSEWDIILQKYFKIVEKIEIHDGRSCIYLLEKHNSSNTDLQYIEQPKPLFSILMPSYNQAHLISMSIDSVLNQTYENWELIIANDGSTDNTIQIVEEYAKKDKRIKLYNRKNGGPSAALNTALQNSSGDWICWLSSDDLFEPNALETMHQSILSNPNYKFLHFDYRTIQDNEGIESKQDNNRHRAKYDPTEEFQTLNFMQCNYVHGIAWTAAREVFGKVGYFDERIRYASDFDMWLRISAQYKFKYIDKVVAITREHSGADTSLFSNAGFFDSTISILNFLNENTFDKLFPNVDLSKIEGINYAIEMAIRIALNLDAFMYRGVGYVPALIDKLNEWISCSLPRQVIDWVYTNIIEKYLIEINKIVGLPQALKDAYNRLLNVREVKFVYQEHEPYTQFENNINYLRSIGRDIEPYQKVDEIEMFIDKVKQNRERQRYPDGELIKAKQKFVNITVLTYNRLEFTKECLSHIVKNTNYPYVLTVVDNNSTDGTKEYLKELYDNNLIKNLVLLKENVGVAKGANIGWYLEPEAGYYLKLDNDIVLQKPDWLNNMIDVIDNIPQLGALAYNFEKKSYPVSNVFNRRIRYKEFGNLGGACFLIPKRTEKQIGYWIEEYGKYGEEDSDYCHRILLKLQKIAYMEDEDIGLHLPGGKATLFTNDFRAIDDIEIETHSDYRHWKDTQRQENMLGGRYMKNIYAYERGEKSLFHQHNYSKNLFSTENINSGYLSDILFVNKSITPNAKEHQLSNKSNDLPLISIAVPTMGNRNEVLRHDNLYKSTISIIIPVLNNIDLTLQCIKSIIDTKGYLSVEIIIIDNDSDTQTKAILKELNETVDCMRLITNKKNESYSKANNQGASIAKGKYLLFLNNDTQLFENTLQHIVETFDKNQSIGIQGGKLLYPNDTIQHCGIVYGKVAPNIDMHYHIHLCYPKDAPCVNIPREYQMVTGALLAIPKYLFNIVEGFDEKYFFGYEDLDICLKVRQAGFKVWYNPKAVAYHFESMTKKLRGIEKFENYLRNPDGYDAKNNQYFLSKWKNIINNDADDYYIMDGENDKVSDRTKIANANSSTTDKLRVLTTMYGWNESGGGTMFPKSVCKELAKNNIDISVFYATHHHPESKQAYYLERKSDDGVNLFGVYNRPTVFLDPDNPLREVNDPEVVRLFSQVLDEVKPDIVHFQNFLGLSFALAKETKRRGIPTLYTPHNYHLIDPALYMINSDMKTWESVDLITQSEYVKNNPDKKSQYQQRKDAAINLLNNEIDYTLAVSTRVQQLLSALSGNINGNIKVLNQINPITQKLHNEIHKTNNEVHSPIRFGFIGSVLPHKGIHNIVKAAQEINKNDAQFFIYGSGNDDYINIMKRLDTKGNVQWMGEYKQDQLPNIANNLDVAIVPSIWEDCAPLVIAENLAMKLPVLGADIGGIRDFVRDRYNGALYSYNSVDELVILIKELIDKPQLIAEWRKNISLNISFESFVKHTIGIYHLLHKNKRLSDSEIQLHYLDNIIENKNMNIFSNKKKSLRAELGNIQQTNTVNIPKEDNHVAVAPVQVEDNTFSADTSLPAENTPMNRIKLEQDLSGGFANQDAQGVLPKELPSPLRLNLGCGRDVREGFLNLDLFSTDERVIKMDIRKLGFPDNSVDLILASDVLEHFSHRETDSLLKEWGRVLKKGGILIIRCPSLRLQAKAYISGAWDADIASYMIFGGQTNPGDYHCIAFDEASIRKHLTQSGFKVLEFDEQDTPQNRGYINLNMEVISEKV